MDVLYIDCDNFVTGCCLSRPTKNCIFLFGKSPIKTRWELFLVYIIIICPQ